MHTKSYKYRVIIELRNSASWWQRKWVWSLELKNMNEYHLDVQGYAYNNLSARRKAFRKMIFGEIDTVREEMLIVFEKPLGQLSEHVQSPLKSKYFECS